MRYQLPGGRVGHYGASGPGDYIRVDAPHLPQGFTWFHRGEIVEITEERFTALSQAWNELDKLLLWNSCN